MGDGGEDVLEEDPLAVDPEGVVVPLHGVGQACAVPRRVSVRCSSCKAQGGRAGGAGCGRAREEDVGVEGGD